MEFWEMLKAFHSDPKAMFGWQGILIYQDEEGNIVDGMGDILKLDKYTINYTYTRIK
jgi:hypothetical protein